MQNITVTCISIDEEYQSVFLPTKLELSDHNGMWISPRQSALNFRHRFSKSGYESDWHVAGDPTLIVVRRGVLTIELRDGSGMAFGPGDQFIAADYLPPDIAFAELHGHRAFVSSDDDFEAVHIKLSDDPAEFHQYLNRL